jgi:uncharacterized protein (TIGR02246 family)
MSTPTQPSDNHPPAECAVRALYQQVLAGWNARDGAAFAAPFAEDGAVVGCDGSQHTGQAGIAADLQQIFANHPTPAYVAKVRGVRLLTPGAAILHAVAGMAPAGQTDLDPRLHAVQTLVAVQQNGQWRVVFFQTTPVQYHGRPELVQQLTDELRQCLPAADATG